MEDKSFVGMAYHVCPVCMMEHDPLVMIDKRLQKTLTAHEFAGWAMCPEHEQKKAGGYIALVVVTNTDATTLEKAKRTGDFVHIRKEAWPHIFNMPAPEHGLGFIDEEAFAGLQKLKES